MRMTRCFALAAFVAGVAMLLSESGTTAADPTPSKEDLRKLAKDLRQAGKTPEEVRKILAEKFKGAVPAGVKPVKPAETPAPAVQTPATTPAAPVAIKDPFPFPAPSRDKKSAAEVAKLIDGSILKKLAELKLSPSPICSDEEFLRRTYLDITGVIPTADQAKSFLDSKEANKRSLLIDQLLASPNFGRHMADIWQAKLYPKESANRFVLKEPFVQWMAESFNKNMPWNQFVSHMLAGTGTVADNPAVTFVLANQAVDKLTDHVGNHFLNIQLQCAQCHNHPFIKEWKQTDYWGVAAFFSRVQPDRPKNGNKGGDNTQIGVRETSTKTKVKDFFPEATKTVPPKFFRGEEPKVSQIDPLRPVLLKWMTSADNPFFAKAMVNRTWAQLFGPGFVNPIEDMHDDNEATHPELLAALSDEFGKTGFDLKHVFRSICNSQTYQRTSKPIAANENDDEFFSHQTMKVMTPEQLYDSLSLVSGPDAGNAKRGNPTANAKRSANTPRDQFVAFFLAGADEPNTTDYDVGIPQALRMMNSSKVFNSNRLVQDSKNAEPALVVEKIYLAALSRRPTAEEAKTLMEYVTKNGSSTQTFGDILWAVLNSSEFTMVR